MKVKRFIIVPAIIMILLAFSGCTNKATTLSNEDIPLSSQPSLSPTRKPEQEFYPQVVINDSLLDLNYDDFMEKYNTLSDDYEIEMFAAVNMYTDSKELDINEETNTITKKQAAEVTEIYGGDFEAIFVVSLR
ncbi:MAG: hypothetical protein LBR68_04680 [Lachnoclostridium sp.]|nr:hypothetical protein [Lachnoclostridium sp.]